MLHDRYLLTMGCALRRRIRAAARGRSANVCLRTRGRASALGSQAWGLGLAVQVSGFSVYGLGGRVSGLSPALEGY